MIEQLTPQRLIYNAWQNTPRPIIYHTKDAKGNPAELQIKFTEPRSHPDITHVTDGDCAVCGIQTDKAIPIKKVFGNTYLDWGIHAEPDSPWICEDCAFCVLTNPDTGRVRLSKYSFVASDTLHVCNREEMRDWLIDPPEPPFVMVCSVSQKKHLATKSRVSYQREYFYCNLEERVIPVQREKIQQEIETIELLRGLSISKAEIERGIISQNKFTKLGLETCELVIEKIQELKKSDSAPLAAFVAQINESEDAICRLKTL